MTYDCVSLATVVLVISRRRSIHVTIRPRRTNRR